MAEDQINITCNTCKDYYTIGKTAVLMLKGHGTHTHDNSIIFAQVHGHLYADSRWVKSSNLVDVIKQFNSESKDHVPLDPNPLNVQQKSTSCIFSTSRVTVSPSHLYEKGVLLEFEIPLTCIPSFRGLSGSICYYLSITVQSSASSHLIHFPIIVNGCGNSTTTQLTNSFSCLICYPVTSLPVESYYADATSKDISNEDQIRTGNTIYNIKDVNHICKIYQKLDTVIPGQDIQLLFDFTENIQNCVAVKVSLVMKETRGDGSRIQDKVLGCVIRDTQEAQQLHIFIPLSRDAVCTFDCPVFKVFYQLEIEFCLEQNNDLMDNQQGLFDNAFSFLIPLKVTDHIIDMRSDETNNSGEKTKSVIQLAHLCLESKNNCFPVFSN